MAIHASKRDLPNKAIFGALGQLVYAFAQLEQSLLHALATALGDTEEANVVLAGLNFNQALDRFSVLYATVGDSYEGGMSKLCSTLAALTAERNRHIHSNWAFWGSGAPARIRTRLKRNKGVAFSMETVDPGEVLHLARRMDEQTEAIYRLRIQYMEVRVTRRVNLQRSMAGELTIPEAQAN